MTADRRATRDALKAALKAAMQDVLKVARKDVPMGVPKVADAVAGVAGVGAVSGRPRDNASVLTPKALRWGQTMHPPPPRRPQVHLVATHPGRNSAQNDRHAPVNVAAAASAVQSVAAARSEPTPANAHPEPSAALSVVKQKPTHARKWAGRNVMDVMDERVAKVVTVVTVATNTVHARTARTGIRRRESMPGKPIRPTRI